MEERRLTVPILLGAILFFVVMLWWDVHNIGGSQMPDKLETNVPGYGNVITTRDPGQSDQAFFEEHIDTVILVGGQVER